ncbi:MAG: DUF4190 domain-containing protein, partial [Thermoleophilaceae bacterium]|nr:DUF4190 domain-containing protein [Thermoleophilaceae bacterium]
PQAPPVQQWQGQAGWPPAPPPAQSQGWSAPPGQPYVWAPAPPQPDNGSAVAGLVLSLVAGGLLIVSFGLSSLVSVGCAIAGILQSRKGQRKIRAGETAKHEGVAQAGVIIGWISLVLAVLATVAWILIGILYATNESFQDDLDRELENSDSVEAVARAAVASVRAGAHLLG